MQIAGGLNHLFRENQFQYPRTWYVISEKLYVWYEEIIVIG